ncbi:MAG: ribonuclease H-like domain-containing protein [Candidatus Micrarchaeia archaeon]|jgi:DNA polymerase III epsilon subunit-like protein
MTSREMVVDTETTGLSPLTDRIICIGTSMPQRRATHTFMEKTEKETLQAFWDYVFELNITTLIGFNLGFDWGFLKLRSLKYGIRIRHFDRYKERKDLMVLLNSYERYPKGKLKDYADFFGFPCEDSISGADVPELFKAGKFDEICRHLESDVLLTTKIWERCKECELV